jgi:membrane-bound lytic murein transglycosylase F
LAIFLIGIVILIVFTNREAKIHDVKFPDLPVIKEKGVLRALTLYSSTSYFLYRDKEMGYEYELCSQLADSLGVKLQMIPVNSVSALLDSLDKGAGDIIAYNVQVSEEINKNHIYCGRDYLTHQVLVQEKSGNLINNVTELPGKEIIIQEDSRYHKRLDNLNDELGGGIIIKPINPDSLTPEELISKVASGEVKYTIADNNLARLNATYYKNLDVNLKISFPQQSFWLVRDDCPLLAAEVDRWFRNNVKKDNYMAVTKRYFERSKSSYRFYSTGFRIGHDGKVSPFDNLFKKYGRIYNIDWRLLASIAFQESNYETDAVSWAGAKGLMQVMPKTAKSFGLNPDSLFYPDVNIKAAASLLRSIRYAVNGYDSEQKNKLMLAGFNSGLGHLKDARALARKYGKNPEKWDGDNVSRFVLLKSQPKYYQDNVCEQGYLRGEETEQFVSEVWTRYKYIISKGVK